VIKVKLPNRVLGITFSHPYREKVELPLFYDRSTVCQIFELHDDGPVEDALLLGTGEARCSYKDNFCKEAGRKIALTRALRTEDGTHYLNNEARTIVWETYLDRPRPKSVKKVK